MFASKTMHIELTEQEYKAALSALIISEGMKRLEADNYEAIDMPEYVEKDRTDADALSRFSRKLVHAYQHADD